MLLIGRLIVGLGIGLASMTVPMFISESAPLKFRGKLTVVNNAFITGGQVTASILDGIFFSDHKNGWRYMLGFAAVPSVIQFIGFLFMPESPRWLVLKGKEAQARRVLIRLRGDDEDVDTEIESIRSGHEEALRAFQSRDTSTPVLIQILQHPPTRRALILGCSLQMFQQLAGINTVMYYSATIVEMAGVRDPQMAVWAAAGIAGVNFAFTIFGLLLVDRLGRRKLTLGSLFGVTLSLALLAVGFQFTAYSSPNVTARLQPPQGFKYSNCFLETGCTSCINRQDCGFCFVSPPSSSSQLAVNGSCLPTLIGYGNGSLYGPCHSIASNDTTNNWAYNYCPSSYAWMTIVALVLYLVFFAPGMGPMPWTVNSEIFPTWARSSGVAMSTSFNWIFNLLISMTFLTLTESMTRYGTFWLYSGIAFLGFCFLVITLPETKGKSLEDMEQLFGRPWNFLFFKL